MAASNVSPNPAALPMERELIITRIFDAPRELVFRAWTDPQHMARWWGPKHFTSRVEKMDVKPGGAWRIIMCAPDGAEHPAQGVYREILEPQRLVFTNDAVDKDGNVIIAGFTTVTFDDQNGKTKLTLETRGVAKVAYAAQYLQGMEMGWTQSLERLGESLEKASDREIVITRVFDAPRDLVFQVWTDPKHVGSWWGPNGFTTTTHEIDIRPGGVWRFMMHGPDGVDYPNKIVYLEIAKPALLVYDHGDEDQRGFHVTVTFAEENGKTRLTMRSLFATAQERDMVVTKYHAIEGGNQTLDRFGEHLANTAAGMPKLLVSRVFDAPRDLVWKAVTEAEHLMHWWGPKSFTTLTCNVDLRPGGLFQYSLRAPDGHTMWGKWTYREIVAPERVVSVVSDTDERGNPLRNP